jgi:tetratricopeptide (TPR) repeat protein
MRTFWCPIYIAIIVLLYVPPWGLGAGQASGEENVADQVDAAIRHAETYYLLSVSEQGDVPTSQAGLRELEHAEEMLKQGNLPPEEMDRLNRHVKTLKSDLQDRIGIMRWTLEGVFPLTGFYTSSLFTDSGPTAIYRLIDDPAIKATRDAAANLVARATELEKKQAPLPVVFACVSPRKTPPSAALQAEDSDLDRLGARNLEHAARQVFLGSPQFQVQMHAAVEDALAPAGKETPPRALDDFRAGHITTAVEERLLKAFGPRLLVVVIRQADVVADVHFYRMEGRILEASNPRQEAFSTSGFGRDRRDRLAWILWANAALFVISYAAYALIVHTHRAMAGGSSWTTLLVLPLVAFVVGRTLPYAVSPLLGSIRLPPGTPALASFWIACLAGLGFLGAPLVAYWLASPWLAELWPSLSPGNRGGALFAAMGAGIAAYLAGPMLLYSEKHLVIDVMLMSISVMVLAYLLGRTLDYSDPLPISLVFVPLILTMPAGAALLHADAIWLGFAAGSIAVTATAIVVANAMHRKRRLRTAKSNFNPSLADQARIGGGIPTDVQELVRRAENPIYQRFPAFDRAWDRMSDFLGGHCCHLGLFGSRGAGKTSTVQTITTRLAQELEKRGSRPALLCGSCPQPISEPISYAPFREALAQHFEVNLLAPPGPKMQQISQTLGGLFGSVIPFARILFPHSAGTGDAAAKPDEINASIAWMLRRLSKTRPILLFLDDVQWLDEASSALVKYLLEEFPAGGNTPVAVILVANSKSCLADLGFDVTRCGIELAYPSVAEQAQILVRGVGLQAAVAEDVLARTGAARETDGGLLWPLQVVARLARSGVLARSEEGFVWANGAWPADFAIPAHMQAAIQEQWNSAAQYHAVLACAACGCDGCEFRVSVLADALGRTCLDLLIVLDEIERTTGMVHDVRDRDDVYAFHSSFLLEVIRGKLGIAGHGARKADVPQIVREYHARLAIALEAGLKTSQSKLYEVANHFYAAGARYAAKGVEYCLEAASASATSYDFRRAKIYLEMAEECAELSAAGPLVEMEKQVILCREAQVASQGEQRTQAAAAELAYLKEHPGAPARLVLAVAQLCYDVGHRSHEPRWYEDAARLCRQIVAHPASPQDEAEARHIMAVSQPYERRAERIAELRKAHGLLEHAPAEDQEASRRFAQIATSLAKELGKGSADERSEAKRLFEQRLQMDAQRQLDDLRGTAMAVAGLGRLEWYNEPKNVAAAEKHFQQNLEISEAIDDIIAQVKMHSLLGACALEKGDLEQALTHYQRSWELAGDPIDRCFAAVGLLRCYQLQNRPDQFEGMAQQLLGLLQGEKIPIDCESQLQAVLKSCPVKSRGEAVRKLWDMTQH